MVTVLSGYIMCHLPASKTVAEKLFFGQESELPNGVVGIQIALPETP